ncbi:hypothetical protein CAPI_06605 [Corynebacterium capitovis DSM 44611]|uniref:hypothetical protein n=1 Tax=Corynebacterium capitovis TaxID=131081 RepID=UPI0003823F7E|nr:hypothetical protein [Corynebacterium capitovis]WKD57861.1 hypothetical protein CAPI_06605 [Corynebacterium capitovis DSM 44611]
MTSFFVFLHVAAAILLLGPVVVATSMFPGQAAESRGGNEEAAGRASILHTISSRYGLFSLFVPLLGAAVLISGWDVYKTNYWIHTAIVLSIIAWAVLYLVVLPQQRKLMSVLSHQGPQGQGDASEFEGAKAKATAGAGVFNLLWIIALVLMFLPHPA